MYSPRIELEPTIFIQGPWMWIGVAVVLVAACILARRRPDYGLAAVLAALPLYQIRAQLGPLPTTFLELLLGAVLLGIASRWPAYRPSVTPYNTWLGVLVAAALVAALVGPDLREGLGLWRAFFLEPWLFFVAAVAVFSRHDLRALLWGAIGAIGIVAVWTAYLLFDGRAIAYDQRLLGPFQSPNYLALLLGPLILMLLAWPARTLLLARAGAVTIGLVMLGATNSRGGQAAFLAGLLVIALFWQGWRRYALAGIVGIAVLGGAVASGPGLFRHTEEQVVSARPVLWQAAADIIRQNPLFGNGPGQFQERFAEKIRGQRDYELYVAPQSLNPHNLWLVTWTEWGLLTVLALAGIVITFGLTVAKRLSSWQAVPAAMMTAVLLHGLVDTSVLKNDLAILFMLVLVLSVAVPGTAKVAKAAKPAKRRAA